MARISAKRKRKAALHAKILAGELARAHGIERGRVGPGVILPSLAERPGHYQVDAAMLLDELKAIAGFGRAGLGRRRSH